MSLILGCEVRGYALLRCYGSFGVVMMMRLSVCLDRGQPIDLQSSCGLGQRNFFGTTPTSFEIDIQHFRPPLR